MQVRALRGATGDYGQVRRGQVIEVPDHRAQQLIKRGLFVPVQMEAAGTAPARPSQLLPNGGETGEMKSASSSHRGRRQRPRPSTESEGRPA